MAISTGPSAPVPPEDTIEALVEHLVAPLLPLRDSDDDPPSARQQELVAKQMHAAVILYNYYHRKQFPSLEFLDFESFCKVASIAKQGLLKYMRHMNRCEEDLVALNNLSITEDVVMEACNVCIALDVSKGFPDVEGWPISKVAVFLVDTTKEKCLLHFSSITQGVWSLVEKVLEVPLQKLEEGKVKRDASKKRTSDGPPMCAYETEEDIEHLAFSVVEQETGIGLSDLSILEHHVTYSFGHEKESARLYIMKYDRVVSKELTEVPIVDVISSLEGPVVEGGIAPVITPVVEYFHILPYIEIISNWLERETTSHGSLHMLQKEVVGGNCSLVSNTINFMEDHGLNKNSDLKEQQALNSQNTKMIQSEHETTKNGLASLNEWVELDNLIPLKHQGANDQYLQKRKNEDILNNNNKVKDVTYEKVSGSSNIGPSRAGNPWKVVDENQVLERDNMLALEDDEVKGKYDPNENKVDTQSEKTVKKELEILKDVDNLSSIYESSKTVSISQNISGCSRMKQQSNESSLQNGHTEGIFTSEDAFINNNNEKSPLYGLTMSGDRSMEVDFDKYGALYQVMKSNRSDLTQATLRVLSKKRDELCLQERLIADEIAQCEMNIQTILNEAEDNMSSNDKPIIEALDVLCSSQVQVGAKVSSDERCQLQAIKRRKLSEAVFSSKNPSQELDEICCWNSWILPTYSVVPSVENCQVNGRFGATVTVQALDTELTCSGDLKGKPCEARDSAASHMLNKLRSMAGRTATTMASPDEILLTG